MADTFRQRLSMGHPAISRGTRDQLFRPSLFGRCLFSLNAMFMLFCFGGNVVAHEGHADHHHVEPPKPADVYLPTAIPDRVILTWNGDPSSTQAVTWRTSKGVAQSVGEIALASADPKFTTQAEQVHGTKQTLQSDLSEANYHSVVFTGLTPDTKYAYRVGDGETWSEWFHFRTASEGSKPFSFIYFGDAQNDLRSMWSRVIREAHSDAPKSAFFLHAGDLVNRAESDAEWGEWFFAGGFLNGMIPSIPVPGNHEQAKVDDQKRLSHHWRPTFELPTNGPSGLEESCYTLIYQGVRFIGLNSNTMLEEQAEWLDGVLSENECPWVICTFHHPVFSTGKGRDNEALRKLWKPVLDKHKVDLVLQGHDHTYGRTGLETPSESNVSAGINKRDTETGTVYVVSVSGPKMYDLQEQDFMVRQKADTQLYQIISIDGNELKYEARTAVGEVYDAFKLSKKEGAVNTLTELIPLEQ
ncbi:metallophosphoesterase family protein [Stieleria sp. JC731]|uniref:purple acid phosphatase family protein n=1 Tax=Pirellulaceae TaxID=2691357 RepID=UPI001E33AF9F|nr:metallophosphoesterase family protein [Stieleria sp. JC731]MCC9603105.1 metallophosphoesterase family protein [Stieleria sp. JC731]